MFAARKGRGKQRQHCRLINDKQMGTETTVHGSSVFILTQNGRQIRIQEAFIFEKKVTDNGELSVMLLI